MSDSPQPQDIETNNCKRNKKKKNKKAAKIPEPAHSPENGTAVIQAVKGSPQKCLASTNKTKDGTTNPKSKSNNSAESAKSAASVKKTTTTNKNTQLKQNNDKMKSITRRQPVAVTNNSMKDLAQPLTKGCANSILEGDAIVDNLTMQNDHHTIETATDDTTQGSSSTKQLTPAGDTAKSTKKPPKKSSTNTPPSSTSFPSSSYNNGDNNNKNNRSSILEHATRSASETSLFKMPTIGSGNDKTPVNGITNGSGGAHLVNPQEVLLRRRALLERSHTFRQDAIHEIQTAPIFTETIRAAATAAGSALFSQFGLLGGNAHHANQPEEMYYYNVTAPSSTFICGSQGSGKSHTLSCLLENCLFKTDANELPRPLTAIVFHYDTFTSDDKGSPSEAAFLASNPGISVRVLCAPTNISTMRRTYANMNVTVEPLRIRERDLNTKRMVDLMAVKVGGSMPLYMHVVNRILRDLRIEQQAKSHDVQFFKYQTFKERLNAEDLTDQQRTPLDQRLDTLESFMASQLQPGSDWTARPGQLTIVDLSCPCVTAETACQLFNICLSLFIEQDKEIGRVVALDEAHKYMNESSESSALTESLLATIRLQRHLAARIIISTQEPTISPKLLDLCSVTVVHRFTSPAWLRALQKHLAGVSKLDGFSVVTGGGDGGSDGDELHNTAAVGKAGQGEDLFAEIVKLRVGEAFLFAPSAIIRPVGTDTVEKLSHGVLKVRVRQRVTADGGRSIMAS
ncbi:hypothetical protein BD289DRAFT_486017 [Coniella lustricola]|uniref:P-loop containing nucleoside triphosphate hydrolase protein n=1 Tax=Coniella lustricola TaxID=2025994 RepID=A0A2T2ZWL4_9PEZI|nr:hypothetical protein BD289DRAFT_486017 [Coniella lustricola]